MCLLFKLYKSIYVEIIIGWIDFEQLVFLDTSCGKRFRPLLQELGILYSYQLVRAYFPQREVCIPSIPMIQWLNRYNIMMEHITLGSRHFEDMVSSKNPKYSLMRLLSCSHKSRIIDVEGDETSVPFDWFACVQSLKIENLVITEKIVGYLEGFTNLERLELSYNVRVVPILNQVAIHCHKLTELHLTYWDFNEEPLINMLAKCKQLKVLFLCDCISSDRFALYVIVHCRNIIAFNCVRCCLESKRSIGQMFALHRRTADYSIVHHSSPMAGLTDITVLRHSLWSSGSSIKQLELNLWDAQSTIFQEVVSQCPDLTSLVISGYCKSRDTCDGIRDLMSGLPRLSYLRLQGMSIQSGTIAAITTHGYNLTELHLIGQIDANVRLHPIGHSCPQLKSLTLTVVKSDYIDCDMVYILFRCTQLTSLDIGRLNVSDEAFLSLIHVPRLTQLNISFNKLITDTTLLSLATHCWRLRELEVRMCPLLTNAGVEAVLVHCSITSLDVSYCPLLTVDLVPVIARECFRRLETLKICMTNLTAYRPLKKLLLKCKRLRNLTLWEWKKVAPMLVKVKKRHALKVKFY